MPSENPIVVIGGSRGTGLLIAQLLSRRGQPVRVPARNPARALERLGAGFDVVAADLTQPQALRAAVANARAIILTAGVPSGMPARERIVRATDYDGVRNVIAAARHSGFTGRLLYLDSCGVTRPSLSATFLNLIKRNTLRWRRPAEEAIRASGMDYTIIRVGFLLNRPGGQRQLLVTQDDLSLAPRYHIARADVADVFVAALDTPAASRATFDVVWAKGPPTTPPKELLTRLRPDT